MASPGTRKTTSLTRIYSNCFAVLVPGVVLQLQLSQSTDQDLVAFYGGEFGTKFGNGSYLKGNRSYLKVRGSYLEGNESSV